LDKKIKQLATVGLDEQNQAKTFTAVQEATILQKMDLGSLWGLLCYVYWMISKNGAFCGGDAYNFTYKNLHQSKTNNGKDLFKIFIPAKKKIKEALTHYCLLQDIIQYLQKV
jgi:hypothetical protein